MSTRMQPRVTAVAPRAGAWIETKAALGVIIGAVMSRPARARGLKQSSVKSI